MIGMLEAALIVGVGSVVGCVGKVCYEGDTNNVFLGCVH